jgi:acyl-CoA hydrolase
MVKPITPAGAVALLKPGMRVFVQGMANESRAFLDALVAQPEQAAGVTFAGVWVPGMNGFDFAGLHADARAEGIFVSPPVRKSFDAGRFDHIPVSYAGFDLWLREQDFDIAVLQCAPPDGAGRCSFGLNADFGSRAASRARMVVAHINPLLPSNAHDEGLPHAAIGAAFELAETLAEYPSGEADPQLEAVARHAATLVQDGDTIQIGIGKVQAAIMALMAGRNDLGLHSGIMSDELAALIRNGQMNGARKAIDTGLHVTMAAAGTAADAYALMHNPRVALRPAAYTHAPRTLMQLPNLVCLNSALEVDLFGQANGEMANGRMVSGGGGLSDFGGTARQMIGARSVLALPAATPSGKTRIVPQLATPASLRRNEADIVVTEHGVAHLRHLSLDGRAAALIDIAAPPHRDALRDAWRDIRRKL